jgi:hypothetical protein
MWESHSLDRSKLNAPHPDTWSAQETPGLPGFRDKPHHLRVGRSGAHCGSPNGRVPPGPVPRGFPVPGAAVGGAAVGGAAVNGVAVSEGP